MPRRDKPHRPVMMTSDRTVTFSPVHEDMVTEAFRLTKAKAPAPEAPKAAPSVHPREIEIGPRPRIVPRQRLEIVHISAS